MNYGAIGLRSVFAYTDFTNVQNIDIFKERQCMIPPFSLDSEVEEFFDVISEVHCRENGHIGSKKIVTEVRQVKTFLVWAELLYPK